MQARRNLRDLITSDDSKFHSSCHSRGELSGGLIDLRVLSFGGVGLPLLAWEAFLEGSALDCDFGFSLTSTLVDIIGSIMVRFRYRE
jgi:hypothetical protein